MFSLFLPAVSGLLTTIALVLFSDREVLTVRGDDGTQAFPALSKQAKQQPSREVAAAVLGSL
eukprot:1686242-Prorocentrum_lima.AAC.1